MSESSNLYRRDVDRKEEDSSFTKEQGSLGLKERGWKLLKQIENGFKERKSLRSIESRKVSRERVNRFWDLSSIDPDFKVLHFRKVYRRIVKIAEIDLQEKLVLDYGVKCLYLLGILGMILFNWIFVGSTLKDQIMLLKWGVISVSYLLLISIILFIIYLSYKRPTPGSRNAKRRIIAALLSPPAVTLLFMVGFDLIPIKHTDNSLFSMIYTVPIWGVVGSTSTFIVLAYLTLLITQMRPRILYADAILVNGLLEILIEIEKDSSLAYRASTSRIWRKVKGLAEDLQSSSEGVFKSKTFTEIGYALYAYESWLDAPKVHTREDLKVRITEKLKCAIVGDFGEIEKSYPKGFSFRKPLQEIASFMVIFSVFGVPLFMQKMAEILSLDSTTLKNVLPNAYIACSLFASLTFVSKYVGIDKEILNKLLDLIPVLWRGKKD